MLKTIPNNDSATPLPSQPGDSNPTPKPGIINRLTVNSILDVVAARLTARKVAEQLGYDLIDQTRLATIAFELTYMMMTSAGGGELLILWYETMHAKGLKYCCCIDHARVYPTDENLVTPKPEFSKLKSLADEFEVITDPQCGDSVAVTIWLKHDPQADV